MSRFLRLFALLIALIILLTGVVGCDLFSFEDDDDDDERSTRKKRTKATADPSVVTTDPNYAVTTDPNAPGSEYNSKLPNYNWDGDYFYILGADGGTTSSLTNFEIWREGMPGDVVGDAVWVRNESLKKKYNFYVEQNLVKNVKKEVQTLYDAQDDLYDLVIYKPADALYHARSGYLLDLNTITYIDFDHPAWSKRMNESLSIGGRLYFTTSHFLLQDKTRTYTLFYNRDLAKERDLGSFEELVDKNQWTIDVFETYAKTFSFDIDGGGGGHTGDSFGVAAESTGSFSALLYGAGFSLGQNDGERIILTGATKYMEDIVTAVGNVWFDKAITCMPDDFVSGNYNITSDIFRNGRALFLAGFFGNVDFESGSSTVPDVGVLPFPKLSSSQKNYYNQVEHMTSSVFAIPCTVSDPVRVGFYLEAVSEASTDTSYRAFVNSKCRKGDEYDEDVFRMLTLSFDSMSYDLVAVGNIGGLYDIISMQVPSFRDNVFVRLYQGKGDKPQADLDDLCYDFRSIF